MSTFRVRRSILSALLATCALSAGAERLAAQAGVITGKVTRIRLEELN